MSLRILLIPLYLSIRLWMKCKTHTNFGATQFEQKLPKFTHEFSIYVTIISRGNLYFTNISFTNNSSTHEVVTVVVVGINRATLVSLSKHFLSLRKVHNEIHRIRLPLPIRHCQRL